MAEVLKLFWNICLLRRGPEAVPTRTWFLCALIAAHLAMATLLWQLLYPQAPLALSFNISLIGIAVAAAASWFALHVRQLEERFPATLGAIAGARTLLGAATAAAYAVAGGAVRQGAFYVLGLWGIVVVGFILHRALSCRPWVGILLSLSISLAGVVASFAALGPIMENYLNPSPE